jgi:RNA polymerase sigma factor (sigma-70 family)
MLPQGSITRCVHELRKGDAEAARQLWERYSRRLADVAADSLGKAPRAAADEDDVAASAFASLCRRASNGDFSTIKDRHDLWRLLVRITERKAIDQLRRDESLKRGGGRVVNETDLLAGGGHCACGLDGFAALAATPEMAAAITDSVRALLRLLDGEQQWIALLKLEGFTNKEIAARIGRSIPTVERRLRLIRVLWRNWAKKGDAHESR